MRYYRAKDGDWMYPRRRNYFLKCCDCGLVHRLNFRLVKRGRGRLIQFQAFRMNKRVRRPRGGDR